MNLRRWLGEMREGVGIAADALVSHRLRTLLTTLGMMIGVMTVIAIVAIIQGLNASFAAQVSGLGAHTVFIDKWKWLSLSDDWWSLRNRQRIGVRELEAVRREAQLAVAVAPLTRAYTTVRYRDREAPEVTVNGTGESYLDTAGGSVAAGRFLVEADVAFGRSVVVLGAEVADRLFAGEPPAAGLGERVRVSGQPFTVVGVMARRGQFLGQPMDANVLIPYTRFGRMFGSRRSMTIAVAASPGQLAALEDELTGILRRVREVPPEKPDDFSINRQEQFLKVYNQLTGALYAVAFGVGLITLIVGGIGIMNIMLVSVHERTREIGVRRALGARRRSILLQFIIESAIVAMMGGGIGTALGLGVGQLVSLTTPLAAAVTPSAVLLGLGFSALVGLVFGSWPAWKAAQLDPVEALRYE